MMEDNKKPVFVIIQKTDGGYLIAFTKHKIIMRVNNVGDNTNIFSIFEAILDDLTDDVEEGNMINSLDLQKSNKLINDIVSNGGLFIINGLIYNLNLDDIEYKQGILN